MQLSAIIAAAGSGERLGGKTPKALIKLGQQTLLDHAIDLMRPFATQIIVVAPATHSEKVATLYAKDESLVVVAGGSSRSISVRNAISVLAKQIDYVLIHDAARALTPAVVVQRVIDELKRGADGVIPVLPVIDTIKEVLGDKVVRTVDRTSLQRVQTPQGFKTNIIVDAHAAAKRDNVEGTDDASLVERMGIKISVVPGDEQAFKITTPFELELARRFSAEQQDS